MLDIAKFCDDTRCLDPLEEWRDKQSMDRLGVGLTLITIALFASCSDSGSKSYWGNEMKNPGGQFYHQLVTGDDALGGKDAWDRLFDTPKYVYGKEPTPFVKESLRYLMGKRALVLAMGEGKDAVYLARKGFEVEGVDISAVALRKARRLAREFGVNVKTVNANLRNYDFRDNHYDVVVNITYFREEMIRQVKESLRSGAVVLFQNYLKEHVQNPNGLSVPRRFLVERGQLKSLFSDFEILNYREFNDGSRAIAQIVARKPN